VSPTDMSALHSVYTAHPRGTYYYYVLHFVDHEFHWENDIKRHISIRMAVSGSRIGLHYQVDRYLFLEPAAKRRGRRD
jgi:hypothetical protein